MAHSIVPTISFVKHFSQRDLNVITLPNLKVKQTV